MAGRPGRVWLTAGLAAVVCGALALALFARPSPAPVAGPPGERLLAASRGLDTVDIQAAFDPVGRTVDVDQTLTLQNRTGVTQRLAVLRTYANAMRSEDDSPAATDELHDLCYPEGFSPGGLTFRSARLQMAGGSEQGATYAYGDDAHTVLRVTLPGDWLPGETLILRLRYTLAVPRAAYRFGETDGIWALGNAFAIPSPYVDGAYLDDAYGSIGDPFVSECRNYTVAVTAPEGYAVAGTGVSTTEAAAEGAVITRFAAPAVRDFALCISRETRSAQTAQNGVLLTVYARAADDARTLLRYAAQALACYDARYGAYPYQTLTLCEADFPLGGMEYPALTLIGSAKIKAGGETLEQLVAHEVAHQWWYAAVGSDPVRQAWQDEALAQFSLLDYWETRYGRDARDSLQYALVDTAMRLTIPQGVTPGSPLDYFGDLTEYGIVVYNRGAAALCALDLAMNGGLDGFLASYYDTYAFALTTRADFETLLARYTGEDWSPLLSDYLDTYVDS